MLVSALLARNEADRFLRPVLERCLSFSDTVLLLDDRSTDATPQIAQELGCQVRTRSVLLDPAWGHESAARKELWDWGVAEAKDGWLLICDADQILHGDPRPLTEAWDVNAWAFPLYDAWSATHYRADGFWQAHLRPRTWMFCPSRVPEGWVAQWDPRGIHPGHAPANFPTMAACAPPDYYWEHLAYSSPELRAKKHRQYLDQKDLLMPGELAHAESILA